jgi:hypothetical protein
MKINFLFLTRKEPFFPTIWKRYFENANVGIYVYSDLGHQIQDPFFQQYQVQHSTFKDYRHGQVTLKLDFLKKALKDGGDYFVFLPEDSLPLKSLSHLINTLDGRSIFSYVLDPHVPINDGRVRYGNTRHFNFPDHLRYKNDDWLILSSNHAEILVEKEQDCLGFECPTGGVGGEHFVSSVLNANNELQNVMNKICVIEHWVESGPFTFWEEHNTKIDEINQTPHALFLRKFRQNTNLDTLNFLKTVL